MAYCGPRGIPLDQFLTWPESSQQAAMHWQARESRRHDCGTHPEDWDPAHGGSKDFQHWHPVVCIGCQKKQQAMEALKADNDKTKGLGLAAALGPASACPQCNHI